MQVCKVTFDQPLYIKAAEICGSNTAATSSAIIDEDIVPTTVEINVEDTAPDDEEKMKPNTFSTILGRA